jgi:hypothetical protein
MTLTFRIDDISLNTDAELLASILQLLRDKFPEARIILAVSPIVFDMSEFSGLTSERPFPAILNAHSDWRVFLAGNRIGLPHWLGGMLDKNIELASHGLVHVDHRLLSIEAQEFSILISRSIVGSGVFVPPFNKWNSGTEAICERNSIELIKWEDGWNHLGFQPFDPSNSGLYYFHTHDFNFETLKLKLGL